jgi:DNA-binding transcriptional ArsR family regulator
MSSIFPLRDTVTPDREREPRLVDLDEDTADEVFEALSSGTTRSIFLSLHENPQTASDLAETTDTSVQNVQYHIGKLEDAELVEVVDTWYSERGTEMKVYAPKDDSLVLFAGRDKQSTLRSLLNRVAGIVTLLVPVSVLAALGANWTADTEESGDPSVFVDTAGSNQTGAGPAVVPEAEGNGGNQTFDIAGGTSDGTADAAIADATTADGVVFTENNTAYVFDNETAWEVQNASVTDASTMPGIEESRFVVEGQLGDTVNETIFLVRGETDPGSNVTLPVEAVDTATDTSATIAGMDPALAVGASVLLGGLLVAGALAAWYGVPGRSTESGADGGS